jgi:undecaprenyl diphosphate synthase
MELLVNTISKETPTLMKNNIRLVSIGQTQELPASCRKQLETAMQATAGNTHMVLNLALSYGGRRDILEAARQIANLAIAGDIDPAKLQETDFASYLSTAGMPDPELMIRTSGEFRISNFLLWELAYAELYITNTLWPDFRRSDLYDAIADFQTRERRFGKTSEQIARK